MGIKLQSTCLLPALSHTFRKMFIYNYKKAEADTKKNPFLVEKTMNIILNTCFAFIS